MADQATDVGNHLVHTKKANLIIAGAPKCGTTAWMQYLSEHPDVFFPSSKEDCYFALDLPNFRFIQTEEEYSGLFVNAGNAKVVGEASAMYLFSEAAAKAIRDYNPEAKILIFLRNQDEYLPSLHNQFLREFSEEIVNFETAWNLSGRRPSRTVPRTCLEPGTLDYKAMGKFDEQVARYLDIFPPQQVKVIRFHEWSGDPRGTYLEILKFLGLEDDGRTHFSRVNPGVTYRSRSAVRLLIYPPQFLRRANKYIQKMTGLDADLVQRVVRKLIHLMSAPRYPDRLTPTLRAEICEYYAEGNQRLDRALRHSSAQTVRSRVKNRVARAARR